MSERERDYWPLLLGLLLRSAAAAAMRECLKPELTALAAAATVHGSGTFR